MRKVSAALAAALVLVLALPGARAGSGAGDGAAEAEREAGQATEAESPSRRAAATVAAVVPGAILHGSGHYVLGDRATARRLLLAELGGLAAVAAGVATVRLSRGDESLGAVYVPLIVGGGTVVIGTFLADLLGVVSPPSGAAPDRAVRPGEPPDGALLSVGLGYRFAQHPNLDVEHMGRAAVAARAGPVRLAADIDVDTGGAFHQERVVAAYQTGWRPAGAALVEIGGEVARRRLVVDGVTSMPFAIWLETLWDLGGAVPRLPGAYARARVGGGVEVVRYDAGVDSADRLLILVAEAGLGFRWGRLESELSYDHRQDGLSGGAWTPRLPGMLGSFGYAGRLRLGQGWALAGEARYGTGVTAWTGLQRSF